MGALLVPGVWTAVAVVGFVVSSLLLREAYLDIDALGAIPEASPAALLIAHAGVRREWLRLLVQGLNLSLGVLVLCGVLVDAPLVRVVVAVYAPFALTLAAAVIAWNSFSDYRDRHRILQLPRGNHRYDGGKRPRKEEK